MPWASAALIVRRGVAGLGDVELARSAARCPAVLPPAQVVPEALVRSAGTNTW